MGEISDSICGKALVTLSDPDDERLATSLVADARNHAQLRVALVLRHVKTPRQVAVNSNLPRHRLDLWLGEDVGKSW